ncbi:MAG: succinate dehydrogenase/fumarate reductase iron-sulfur subunit [bacterium]
MNEATATLNVTRYSPGQDQMPRSQSYSVPYQRDWVILDALNYIKDHIDGTLSYRWSCRMGVCGSCGMMVNGVPKLTCAVFLRDFYPQEIRIEPLVNFPIIRDLVIDMSDFLDKLKSVKPWIIRKTEKQISEGEYLQTPEELNAYKQFTQCINCMLCYAACPVYGMEPEFLGPAAIALGYRYNLDSRDQGKESRQAVLGSHEGIWQCTFVGECTEVCPKEVDPAAAIQRSKVEITKDWFKSVLLPWGQR